MAAKTKEEKAQAQAEAEAAYKPSIISFYPGVPADMTAEDSEGIKSQEATNPMFHVSVLPASAKDVAEVVPEAYAPDPVYQEPEVMFAQPAANTEGPVSPVTTTDKAQEAGQADKEPG